MRTSYLNIQTRDVIFYALKKKKRKKKISFACEQKIPSNSFQGVTRFINDTNNTRPNDTLSNFRVLFSKEGGGKKEK